MEGGRQGCEEMERGCVEAQEKPERNSLHGKFSVYFCTDVLFEAPRSFSGFDPSLFFVCVCGFLSLYITTHRHNHLRIFLFPGDGISRTSCLLVSFKPELSPASYGK